MCGYRNGQKRSYSYGSKPHKFMLLVNHLFLPLSISVNFEFLKSSCVSHCFSLLINFKQYFIEERERGKEKRKTENKG